MKKMITYINALNESNLFASLSIMMTIVLFHDNDFDGADDAHTLYYCFPLWGAYGYGGIELIDWLELNALSMTMISLAHHNDICDLTVEWLNKVMMPLTLSGNIITLLSYAAVRSCD